MKVAADLRRDADVPRLSIIIPMLNEAHNIGPLFERLFDVLDGLDEDDEVICIDDGSSDDTLDRLHREQERRPRLRVISFARNFGQHAAIMAGFGAARGDWLITLDADLQNPPEEIPKLVDKLRAGHDLVHTYRQGRQDPFGRRLASRLINIFVRRASGIVLRDFGCMLRGYQRSVVDPMVERQEYHTFIPALATLHARNPVEIPVAHAARQGGRSAYSLWKLFSLQLDLVTSFSLVPLRLLMLAGIGLALGGMLFGAFLMAMRLVYGAQWAAQGVFTLFAVLFFLVGAQFIAFGVLGEYIGRVYQEVRTRPRYLIRQGEDLDGGAAVMARGQREQHTIEQTRAQPAAPRRVRS